MDDNSRLDCVDMNLASCEEKIKTQAERIKELEDGYKKIIDESNKPLIHEKTWKEQSVEWEISFMVAYIIARKFCGNVENTLKNQSPDG